MRNQQNSKKQKFPRGGWALLGILFCLLLLPRLLAAAEPTSAPTSSVPATSAPASEAAATQWDPTGESEPPEESETETTLGYYTDEDGSTWPLPPVIITSAAPTTAKPTTTKRTTTKPTTTARPDRLPDNWYDVPRGTMPTFFEVVTNERGETLLVPVVSSEADTDWMTGTDQQEDPSTRKIITIAAIAVGVLCAVLVAVLLLSRKKDPPEDGRVVPNPRFRPLAPPEPAREDSGLLIEPDLLADTAEPAEKSLPDDAAGSPEAESSPAETFPEEEDPTAPRNPWSLQQDSPDQTEKE
ncbi:MAG: hypothetical protein LBJ11_09770 [Oscillospiraceae bacterium]|jgi:hypothetical protein|nr:hypothetical protein [Oscillospiraceae bacterium]